MANRCKISISFYVRRTKILQNGEVPIYVKIVADKSKEEFSIAKSVDPELWNTEKNGVIGNTKESREINAYIHYVRLQASHPNLFVSETIPDDLSKYNFVFIDSVSRAGLDMDSIRKLRQSNPRTAFLFIYHTTKEGNFRGKNENAHEVDVIVEVADGKATGNGRFGIGGEVAVF